MPNKTIKFIDLFAGIGGTRIGFQNACRKQGLDSHCVFTSEIKDSALKSYSDNFGAETIHGDITSIDSKYIPDFDYLLAGFPCQPFSSAGQRGGFMDTRGTLFFEIERILKDKLEKKNGMKPSGFILENVEGLVNHDKQLRSDKVGRTLNTILGRLDAMGFNVTWKVLNSEMFGVPQRRNRLYIVGVRKGAVKLEYPDKYSRVTVGNVLERGLPLLKTKFTAQLLDHFDPKELQGMAIKDKRGGRANIHSWSFSLKGKLTKEQVNLMDRILLERRRKVWAEKWGIEWMDGMPLTLKDISSFFKSKNLKKNLTDLVAKGYLVFEYPKELVTVSDAFGNSRKERRYATHLSRGYNIVTGKLSFPITKILSPKEVAPTLVAMDAQRMAVVDGKGIRKLTIREGLRMFGFPEHYHLNVSHEKAFDLLGNTVVVPVVEYVVESLLSPGKDLEKHVNALAASHVAANA